MNLYGFVKNNGANWVDVLGREQNYIETNEERIARIKAKWPAEKASGLNDIQKLLPKLELICDNYISSEYSCECKNEAKIIADKIHQLWNDNHGRGTNYGNANAGGYLCYHWAGNFAQIPTMTKLRVWQAHLMRSEQLGDGAYVHYWTDFTAYGGEGTDLDRSVSIDNGFLKRGLIHTAGDLPGAGWQPAKKAVVPTWMNDDEYPHVPMIWK